MCRDSAYGMRLPTIADRIAERFIRPLAIDRMRALVRPAMEQAAKHLPVGSPRPAMILFTDGKHDVPGVPVSQVQPALQRP